ncbi:MAG TPA: hypothetical protein VJZ27_18820, partial [Aggregatilineales bacterium]|nr:hypothetical protein [Aggregatilineales bacterium]
MRTQIIEPRVTQREPDEKPREPSNSVPAQPAPDRIRASAPAAEATHATMSAVAEREGVYNRTEKQKFYLAFAAELNAHLASAARPVWLMISRDSLDMGPEGDARCVVGTPTSDLRLSTLRDLRIPYDAVWFGLACANPGI